MARVNRNPYLPADSPAPVPSPAGPAVRVPEYAPFPVAALPPAVREFVAGVAASVDADPAFAALPALTLTGAAVGAAIVISPKRGFREPPALWCCVVADSGTGKSPGLRPAEALADGIDGELRETFATDYSRWKADPDADRADRPTREYFAVADTTVERLAEMLAGSPRGVIVTRDELAGWFGSFTRYKSGGGSDVPNWLSMYDAGPVRVYRKTGEPRDIEAARGFVAVCGGIQPDILYQHLADPAYVASGLAARLSFAMPPKRCPRWSDAELSSETERRFAGVLAALRGLPFDPKSGPAAVRLDAAALDRFKKLNDEFAATAEDLDGGPMAAVLPKGVRLALRLALIWYAASEAAAGRDPGKGCITDEAMAAGEVLARWFVGESERVYAALAERPEERAARTLAEWVKRKGGRVRPCDLQRSNPQRYPTATAAELALDGLVSAGFGVWDDDPARPTGGWAGRGFVLFQHPPPDTRHSPTLAPGPGDTGAGVSPDTCPEPRGETPENPGETEQVSASVGCRVSPPAGGKGERRQVSGVGQVSGPGPGPARTGNLFNRYPDQQLPD